MKYVWLIWLLSMNPLGSAEMNIYYIGAPHHGKPCKFEIEDNRCDPKVLHKERIIYKR